MKTGIHPPPSATTVATSILLLNSPPFRVLVSSLLKILHSKLHSSCNKFKKPRLQDHVATKQKSTSSMLYLVQPIEPN